MNFMMTIIMRASEPAQRLLACLLARFVSSLSLSGCIWVEANFCLNLAQKTADSCLESSNPVGLTTQTQSENEKILLTLQRERAL